MASLVHQHLDIDAKTNKEKENQVQRKRKRQEQMPGTPRNNKNDKDTKSPDKKTISTMGLQTLTKKFKLSSSAKPSLLHFQNKKDEAENKKQESKTIKSTTSTISIKSTKSQPQSKSKTQTQSKSKSKIKSKSQANKSSKSSKSNKSSKADEEEYLDATWNRWDWQDSFRYQFHKHQLRIVQYLLTYRNEIDYFIANWATGTGKTPLAFLWSECFMCQLWREYRIPSLTIVVAPPSVQDNFRVKLLEWNGGDKDHVLHFYRFWSMEGIAAAPEEFIRQCQNNFLIVDECHRARTAIHFQDEKQVGQGVQALALLKGNRVARMRLFASATLIVDKPDDLWNLGYLCLRIVPKAKQAHTKSVYPTLEWLRSILHGHMSCIDESEVVIPGTSEVSENKEDGKCNVEDVDGKCKATINKSGKCNGEDDAGKTQTMPPARYVQVLIEMSPEYYQAYRKIEERHKKELEKIHSLSASGTGSGQDACWVYLRQAANKIVNVPSPKRQFIVERILEYQKQRKRGIISSQFLENGLDVLEKSLPPWGIGCVTHNGKMKPADRQTAISLFNSKTSENVDVILNSRAGVVGINLSRAWYQINMEPTFNYFNYLQNNGRGRRLDSEATEVVIYNLMLLKPGREFVSFCAEMKQSIEEKKAALGLKAISVSMSQTATMASATAATATATAAPITTTNAHKIYEAYPDEVWIQPHLGVITNKQHYQDHQYLQHEQDPFESIDVRLYRLQLSKLKDAQPYLSMMRDECCIERLVSKQQEALWEPLPRKLKHPPTISQEQVSSN